MTIGQGPGFDFSKKVPDSAIFATLSQEAQRFLSENASATIGDFKKELKNLIERMPPVGTKAEGYKAALEKLERDYEDDTQLREVVNAELIFEE